MKALGNTLVSGGLNPCLAFENMLNGIEHCIAYYAEDDNRITVCMRHKCMKWFSTFSQHKRNFNNISFLHNFAHNHADMIMCIDNDYLLIFSMLFFLNQQM